MNYLQNRKKHLTGISFENPESNLLTKFAGGLIENAPVKITRDSAVGEVRNIKHGRVIIG